MILHIMVTNPEMRPLNIGLSSMVKVGYGSGPIMGLSHRRLSPYYKQRRYITKKRQPLFGPM